MMKWREEIRTGQYYELLRRGFFDNKPDEIEPEVGEFQFYFDAFRELGTCRPGGLDLQAIPFTAIIEYSKIFEIDDDDFYFVIRMLDDLFLELNSQKDKPSTKKGKGKPNGTGHSSTPHKG